MLVSIASCIVLAARPARRGHIHVLNLVPPPVHVVLKKGVFRIGPSTNIVYSDGFSDDRFAAEQLMEEVLTDTGQRIEPTITDTLRSITLKRLDGPVSKVDLGQGYRLEVAPNHVSISAETSAGMFYGVQTLKQLIRANRTGNSIPACVITDWPALKYRGWQDDISRGPIPTYGFLMKEIRTLSEFKLNMLTLYTEHVFKLKKHPEIAPPDGITADEISDLSSYAKQFHVELVGNFQSFGHFRNILKLPEYRDLGENDRVISPAKEASYKFLADVYSEIAPAYSSPFFNINCDEVSGLGTGPSKDLVNEMGVGGVYAMHINKIAALLRPYGKTPMMWGDIALHHPEIVPKLPKNLIVLPWDYYPRTNFDSEILPFTKFGLQFMVCPGVYCWNELWPDLHLASVNISNFIRDGARNGALGCLNTSWDDDGQNLFDDNWYEFVWGADCSWRPAIPRLSKDDKLIRDQRLARFNQEFPVVFFGLSNSLVSKALIDLTTLRDDPISGGLKDVAFWRDPVSALSSLPDPKSLPAYLEETSAISASLQQARSRATHNAPALDYAIFAVRQARYLGESLAAIQDLKRGSTNRLNLLRQELGAIRESYIDLWQRENCPWWLDKNLARFDDMAGQLKVLAK